jgi:drug/metabolite transporter, DME family
MSVQSSTAAVGLSGGSGAILLAATLWGTTGTAQSFVLDQTGPLSVGAARIGVGGLLLLLVALLAAPASQVRQLLTRPAGGSRRWTRLLLAAGAVSVATYQLGFFAAVATTGVVVGTVVTIGSAPAFAGLLAVMAGRPPTARWLLASAGAAIGCAALVGSGQAAGVAPGGVALALLSGFAYASYATLAGHLITGGHSYLAVIGLLFGGAGLLLTPVLFATSLGWLLTGPGLLTVAYLAVVATAGSYLMYARGLRTTPATTATTLTMVEPAVAALLGVVVVGERLNATAAAGLVMLSTSLLLLVRTTERSRWWRRET